MANTTIEELLNLAYEVRDADQEHENTALRVGGLLEQIIQYLSTVVDLDTLQAILTQFAQLNGAGLIEWRLSRIVCLASMGYDLDNIDGGNWNYTNGNGDIVFFPDGVRSFLYVVGTTGNYSIFPNVVYVNNHTGHAYLWKVDKMVEIRDSATTTIITYLSAPIFSQVAIGESYYYTSGNNRKLAIKLSATEVYSFDPDPKKIYVFLDTRQAMVWDAANRQWISVGGSDNPIINDLITGGRDKALSAEMGKFIKSKIEDVQANIQRLYNNLGNIAFWTAAAKSAAAPIPIDWGGPKHTVTLDLDLTHAVVKYNGETKVDRDTIPNIEEGSTITLTVEAESGYALSSIQSQAGNVDGNTVELTMGQSNVTLDITAVAETAHTVTVNASNCTANPASASVQNGGTFTCQLTADTGYSLPGTVSYGNGQTAAVDGNGNFSIENVTSDLTVTAAAGVSRNVTYDLHDALSSNNSQTAAGSFYTELTYSNDSNYSGNFYNFAVKVMMGDAEVTSSCYSFDTNTGKGIINIGNVTGDIAIEVYAVVVVDNQGYNTSGSKYDITSTSQNTNTTAQNVSDWNGKRIESYLPASANIKLRHCWNKRANDGSNYDDATYVKNTICYSKSGSSFSMLDWYGHITGSASALSIERSIAKAGTTHIRTCVRDIDHCYLYDNTNGRMIWKGNDVQTKDDSYTYNGPTATT